MKIAGVGICTEATGSGLARWRMLADGALADLGGRRDVPILVASCNGAADALTADSWSRAFAGLGPLPIASAACASGLHALWLARGWLVDHDEVIVLAADILSPASHANFAALRVLDDNPAPWQSTSAGFREGEAAVAIRLQRGSEIVGPLLGNDNLAALVRDIVGCSAAPEIHSERIIGHAGHTGDGVHVGFVIGQGTGPAAVDEHELAALPPHVPLATALVACGHTIGASGLLSVALAHLVRTASGERARKLLSMPFATAIDGRPLGVPEHVDGDVLVVCRALGGASAVVRLGAGATPAARSRWVAPQAAPPLRIELLRRIAALPRPAALPEAIVVQLDAPLVPPDDARIGGRLLPSVVLEITPGFVAQLLARTWGFAGPSLTLVGGSDDGWVPTLAAIRRLRDPVLVLHVHARDIEWGT